MSSSYAVRQEYSRSLAPTKKIPPEFFAPEVSAEVVGNLVFGYFESDG